LRLPELPNEVKLILGSAGIFFSFSIFAVLQEDVYKKAHDGEFFAFTFFALLIERGINALVAFLGVQSLGASGLTIPQIDIFWSGLSQMLAMASSNEALRYVSYPTQVLGKSCKMVPVMAGGIMLGGKTYSLIEYAQVVLITIGVCVFNFGGKKKKSGADSPLGLLLIGLSLLMDMFTGGLQDKVKKRTAELNPLVQGPKRPSMHESMMYTNASGFIMALALALITGHLFGGIKFCVKHPQVLNAIVVWALSSAIGQNFVYYTLTQFNPLVLTTVTTTRKIFSTLFSVFRNPANKLNPMQWSGASMVFIALLGDIARKISSKKPSQTPPPPSPPTLVEEPAPTDKAEL
jgi:UDP-galactose transporter B1